MIFGNLAHIDDILPYVGPSIAKALQSIKKTDFELWADGEYEMDGRNLFARVNSYTTEPKEQRRPEKHFAYVDLQLMIIGSEAIGYCPLAKGMEVIEDKKTESDIVFYDKAIKENFVTLRAGDFAIFFPWEAHRPNCNCGDIALPVKKVVVKIKAE